MSDFIRRMVVLGEELLPKVEDVKAENMGDMIDQEMEETQKAIEAASKRIAVSTCMFRFGTSFSKLSVMEENMTSLLAEIDFLWSAHVVKLLRGCGVLSPRKIFRMRSSLFLHKVALPCRKC